MKRIILMMLCIVCFAAPTARAEEPVTLAELKQQTPENLVLDVTDNEGNLVHIDMPVVLPEGETLPVLRVKPVAFDMSEMGKHFPLNKHIEGTQRRVVMSDWRDGMPSLYVWATPENGDKPRASSAYDTESGRYIMPEGRPAGNDMPATRPLEIVRENMLLFCGRDDFDIRVFNQYPMSVLYRYQNVAKWDSLLDLNNPRKGYDTDL